MVRVTPHLSERIRQAYLRHRPNMDGVSPNDPVWSSTAVVLVELHRHDPRFPVDPELFVACQVLDPSHPRPWLELTSERSVTRYRRRVVEIVRLLRAELRAELRWAQTQLRRGLEVEEVLAMRTRAFSALGRYLFAHRQERPDLAAGLRPAAVQQHSACPLYLWACQRLIDPALYPVGSVMIPGDTGAAVADAVFSLN